LKRSPPPPLKRSPPPPPTALGEQHLKVIYMQSSSLHGSGLSGGRSGAERTALLAAKAALDPTNKYLSSWKAGTWPCEDPWVGISCTWVPDAKLGKLAPRILGIRFSPFDINVNLTGTLPRELSVLTKLFFLSFSSMRLGAACRRAGPP
jgi:hypothetical protein